MFAKIIMGVAGFFFVVLGAMAQVDVNKADVTALDGIKGIGPATSKRILEERRKGGDYSSWADLESRVKGVSGKKATALSQAGLTVNGAKRESGKTAPDVKGQRVSAQKTGGSGGAAK